MSTLNQLHRHARTRRNGKPAFTLLELIVVLLVLGILAAIAVPTFQRVKENSVVRVAQTTLEAIDRNGEAIAFSDPDMTDAQVTEAALSEIDAPEGMTITRDGEEVTVEFTRGSLTAAGTVTFSDGIGTIVAATASGGGSSSTSTTVAPAFALSYASTAFSLSSTSQTRPPSVSGGTASSFSYTGTLPTGVSFDTSTGVFTGPEAWAAGATTLSTGGAVSGTHVCVVTTSGGVMCWGNNGDLQIGRDDDWTFGEPVEVPGLPSGVSTVTSGAYHVCAVSTTGGVRCWGFNGSGQLGDGTTTTSAAPVAVSGLTSGVVAVDAGESHTCALTTTGGVKCWGLNNLGQLGDGTTTNSPTPVDVSGLTSGVAAISAGSDHTCALTTAGGIKCWGTNFAGQLGDGTYTDRSTPVDVVGLTSGVASISSGRGQTCAVTTAGGAKCWGDNRYGQLGHEIPDLSPELVAVPTDVTGLTSGVSSISAGYDLHTCAVTTSGGVKCWGGNDQGQLGDGTQYPVRWTPVNVLVSPGGAALGSVATVHAGAAHTCAVTTSGGVKCWGASYLGRGAFEQQSNPVDVTGLAGNPGWPANITVTVTSSTGSTANTNVTLTNS